MDFAVEETGFPYLSSASSIRLQGWCSLLILGLCYSYLWDKVECIVKLILVLQLKAKKPRNRLLVDSYSFSTEMYSFIIRYISLNCPFSFMLKYLQDYLT
jgi:hypothetical protein